MIRKSPKTISHNHIDRKKAAFHTFTTKQLKFIMRQSKIATQHKTQLTSKITAKLFKHTHTQIQVHSQCKRHNFVPYECFWSSTSCERRMSDLNIRLLGWTDKHPSSMTRRLNCEWVSEKQGHITRKAPFSFVFRMTKYNFSSQVSDPESEYKRS